VILSPRSRRIIGAITNKQKPSIIQNVVKNEVETGIEVLLVNKHQLCEVLGNLILLGSDAGWIAEAETIAARQRMTGTLLSFLNDALNRLLNVLFKIVTGHSARSGLTKKAEPPPTCDVNRDSGTDSANGG
jgi:hypothetical protein